MNVDYNRDIISRIKVARALMEEVFEQKDYMSEKDTALLGAKRRNLSAMLQEIGTLVVLHYPEKGLRHHVSQSEST